MTEATATQHFTKTEKASGYTTEHETFFFPLLPLMFIDLSSS